MSANNPQVTCSDIITDVEGRLASPNLNTSLYLPWISTSAQRIYQAIAALGQDAKEKFFGASDTISLTTDTLEHSITDSIPDFGSFIKVEIKYGASGDTRNKATKMRSPSMWEDEDNVSTSYRAKEKPLYGQSGDDLIVIPVPPESGAIAYIRYVSRLPQFTDATDVIHIPFRFMWPIYDYVQAKAIQRVNEDYSTARQIERDFRDSLEEITLRAADEINENDGTNAVEVTANDRIYDDPLNAY